MSVNKKSSTKSGINVIMLFRIISLIIIFICLYDIYLWNKENNNSTAILNEIIPTINIDDYDNKTMDFSNILIKNPDTIRMDCSEQYRY